MVSTCDSVRVDLRSVKCSKLYVRASTTRTNSLIPAQTHCMNKIVCVDRTEGGAGEELTGNKVDVDLRVVDSVLLVRRVVPPQGRVLGCVEGEGMR